MELNWSTFALEILNFLVLVWLLKHFLYKPVMNIIQQRQAQINAQLSEAETKEKNAQALEVRYQNRLSDWENEKQQNMHQLHDDMVKERERLIAEIRITIEQEKEKAKAVSLRQAQDFKRQTEKLAYDQASTFATRLLSRLASPDLENRIATLVLEDLVELPEQEVQVLKETGKAAQRHIHISSVYPLEAMFKQQFETTMTTLLDTPPLLEFTQLPELISGIRIAIGDWRLEASLANELCHFSQQGHYETR